MTKRVEAHRFSASIYKVGINRCVDVPKRIGDALGGRRYVPVVVSIAGHSVRTTLVPGGGGRFRAFLNGTIRKAAGVDTGDRVKITLRLDSRAGERRLPADVAQALRATRGARAAFESATPGLRRALLKYVTEAKKPETRKRRLERGIEILLQEAAKPSKHNIRG